MNKYIEYIKNMKEDENVDDEMYIDLIKGFNIKLHNWLMERIWYSHDPKFIEINECIIYISKELA